MPNLNDVAPASTYNFDSLVHWAFGVIGTFVTGAATWATKTVVRHNEEIALLKQADEAAAEKSRERHEETTAMLREIRDRMAK